MALTLGQSVTALEGVATIVGGNFASVLPVLGFLAEVVTTVEAMKGQTSAQKLAAAQQLITDGVTNVPALAKLVGNPAKLESTVNALVALFNELVG